VLRGILFLHSETTGKTPRSNFVGVIAPEDVVQSAMCSFFRITRAGVNPSIKLESTASAWNILATFVRRKLARALERETAVKRGGSCWPLGKERSASYNRSIIGRRKGVSDEWYYSPDLKLEKQTGNVVFWFLESGRGPGWKFQAVERQLLTIGQIPFSRRSLRQRLNLPRLDASG
jgi:hypothetical protein